MRRDWLSKLWLVHILECTLLIKGWEGCYADTRKLQDVLLREESRLGMIYTICFKTHHFFYKSV